MARHITLIGILHAGGDPAVIAGPSYDVEAMKCKYKAEFAAERVHPKFQRVEFVDSAVGVRKHKNFITPSESKRREKELKRQTAEVTAAPQSEPPSPGNDEPPIPRNKPLIPLVR